MTIINKDEIHIILAEKPSLWKNIAKWLDCNKSWNGFITNQDGTIIITWWFWHLMELQKPSDINIDLKLWKFENLPIFFDLNDKYVVKKPTEKWDPKKQLELIKSFFKKNLDKKIYFYHAGDPDREWELITRLILNEIKKELTDENINIQDILKWEYRMWLKDFSKKTILGEFEKRTDIKKYDKLYECSVARLHWDWYVWMNLSPYYTLLTGSYKDPLNIWRVLSSLCWIVVDKELEIANFKESITYKVIWDFDKWFSAEWFSEKLKDWKLLTKNQTESVLNALKDIKNFNVLEKNIEEKIEYLTELYSLVDLMVDAEKKHWYDPEKTMELYQRLYEIHRIASYPRNDNWWLTDDDYIKAEAWLLGLMENGKYWKTIKEFKDKNLIKPLETYVNNSKVWAHAWLYPLVPPEWTISDVYNSLNQDEKNIFDLVINRFLWVLNWPYIYESSEIILNNWVHYFRTRWKILKQKWWKEYYKISDKENKDIELPDINIWDTCNLEKSYVKEVKNQKPTRYKKSTLWKAIDNLASLVKEDKELSERIRKISPGWERKLWLWTPWTRSDIINKLEDVWYIKIVNKQIVATNKWFKLVSIIKENFRDPITTWEWEDYLKKIEEGEWTYEEFIENLKSEIKKVIDNIELKVSEKYHFEPVLEDTIAICPKCWIWELKHWEKGYGCTSPKCDFIFWKTFLWKILSVKEIQSLLKWDILEIKWFYSEKKKKDYDGNVFFDFNEFKPKIKF